MANDITYRKARAGDAPHIAALIESFAHGFNAGPTSSTPPWFLATITPAAIAACIDNPSFFTLTAHCGTTLAGVVTMRDATHIHHLFVAPASQRRGIARALWERAQTEATTRDGHAGFTVRSSLAAVPVYQHFGFRAVGPRTEKDGLTYVPMELRCGT